MLVNESLWQTIPAGSDYGIQTESDALPRVTELRDGSSLNQIWDQVAEIMRVWNEHRSALSSLLAYTHTNPADAIPQSTVLERFEVATEMGEPTAMRPPNEYLLLGYTFEDYDRASRFTWKALRAMSREQVMATMNMALEMDNRLINSLILDRLFDPEVGVNENDTPVFGLYNGTSDSRPPNYLGKNFAPNHQHYQVSGNASIDSGDIELLAKLVAEHGFNADVSSQLVLLCNPDEAEQIASWRAGEVSANTVVAHHDFVPSEGTPAFYAPQEIVGKRAPEKIEGLKISGSYGPLWIVPLDDIPPKYLACVSTYGANSPSNVVGLREHPVPLYQGFRVIPGREPGYPLTDSFFTRGIGVGVRRRGQAAVMQIKASGSYEVPPIFPGLPE